MPVSQVQTEQEPKKLFAPAGVQIVVEGSKPCRVLRLVRVDVQDEKTSILDARMDRMVVVRRHQYVQPVSHGPTRAVLDLNREGVAGDEGLQSVRRAAISGTQQLLGANKARRLEVGVEPSEEAVPV